MDFWALINRFFRGILTTEIKGNAALNANGVIHLVAL